MVNCLSRNNSKGKEIRVTCDLETYGWAIWRLPLFYFFYSFRYCILDQLNKRWMRENVRKTCHFPTLGIDLVLELIRR